MRLRERRFGAGVGEAAAAALAVARDAGSRRDEGIQEDGGDDETDRDFDHRRSLTDPHIFWPAGSLVVPGA
jgi:hypothetical protein